MFGIKSPAKPDPDMGGMFGIAAKPQPGIRHDPARFLGMLNCWQAHPDVSHCVYVLLNTENGKAYVGQAESLRRRLQKHALNGRRLTLIEKAIAKYGPGAFEVHVLREGVTDDGAREDYEADAIEDENALAPKGYNMVPRGSGTGWGEK